jgi:hypothetical protein
MELFGVELAAAELQVAQRLVVVARYRNKRKLKRELALIKLQLPNSNDYMLGCVERISEQHGQYLHPSEWWHEIGAWGVSPKANHLFYVKGICLW